MGRHNLYFAYGSNMSARQMAGRCPGAVLLGGAELPGYRLAFDLYSERWRGFVADVVEDPATSTHGLLWRVTAAHMAALDEFEGIASGRYRRLTVTVRAASGAWTRATAYAVVSPGPEGPPSGTYFELISAAARENGFPAPARPRIPATIVG